MSEGLDMKVRLRELPAERHLVLPPAFLRELLAEVTPTDDAGQPTGDPGQITLDVELTAEHDTVLTEGSLRGWIAAACSRCLGLARIELDEPFQITFLPHASASDSEEERELNEEDLDLATYEGDEIDLEPQVREQVLLAVPIAPLCSEDCKGLCSQCGADLNQGPCSCPPAPVDPRWSSLKSLKS